MLLIVLLQVTLIAFSHNIIMLLLHNIILKTEQKKLKMYLTTTHTMDGGCNTRRAPCMYFQQLLEVLAVDHGLLHTYLGMTVHAQAWSCLFTMPEVCTHKNIYCLWLWQHRYASNSYTATSIRFNKLSLTFRSRSMMAPVPQIPVLHAR